MIIITSRCDDLLAPDNKRVIIPNGAMLNGSITNYSVEGQLRVNLVIGIAYESDVSKAKGLLLSMMMEDMFTLPIGAIFTFGGGFLLVIKYLGVVGNSKKDEI